MEASQAGPDHRIEDVPSAFCQMGNNHIIIIALIGNNIAFLIKFIPFFSLKRKYLFDCIL